MGGYRRCGVILTLFSCVIWLCANYWSFLAVGRLSTSPINKRQTWAGQTITGNEDKYSISKDRMSNSEMKSTNEKEKEAFNVTDIVLRELQRGFLLQSLITNTYPPKILPQSASQSQRFSIVETLDLLLCYWPHQIMYYTVTCSEYKICLF